ncbi:MAG: T9SS type A sorting domain-containing protein [Ignavibacteriaceae bacterium]|nr:T9SS type A sorting domain-containing protein [Ignavibacteriaceae bacterium]
MNYIYKILVSLTFCLFIISSELMAQATIGPLTSDYRRDIIKNGSNPVKSDGLADLNTVFTIGRQNNNVYEKAAYQWTIPDNLIPDNSSIDSLEICFNYTKSDQYELPAGFYSLSEDITDGSQNNLNQMWTDLNSTPLVQITGTSGLVDYISNNPNNPLNIAFKNALSSNRFVLGLRWNPETVNRVWYVDNPTLTIKVHFTPPQQSVFIDQVLNNGTRIGKIKLWQGSSFSSPLDPGQYFNFYVNSHQVIQGDQLEYSNQKYNRWNSFSDIRNQHDFLILPETAILTSHFESNYYGVKVRNALEGCSDVDGGLIYYKDPWLIDSIDQNHANTYMNRGNYAIYNTINSPLDFSINTYSNYKGIFQNQIYDPQNEMPCYFVKSPIEQDINLGTPWGTHKFYFNNYTSAGTGTLNSNNNVNGYYESPIVFTNTNAIVNANLKGIQLSNNSNTFASTNQRKIISTYSTPVNLFQVYESMGTIWMEKSTDGGTTWTLYPNNGPLVSGSASSPSMDHYLGGYGYDYIFVTYVSGGTVMVCIIQSSETPVTTYCSVGASSTSPTTPVVSCMYNNKVIFVWNGTTYDNQSGLIYELGLFMNSPLGFNWVYDDDRLMPNTNANSINPTIESLKSNSKPCLAWEENNTIKFCKLMVNQDYSITQQDFYTVSDYAGFTNNTKPSIAAVNGGSRLTWIGNRTVYYGETPYIEQRAVFMDPGNTSQSWAFSDNVQTSVINLSSQCYTIAWSKSNTDDIEFTDSHTLSDIGDIPITGVNVQLSNGNSDYLMRAVSFNNSAAPYYFSNSGLYDLNKKFAGHTNSGREGVVKKGDCQFYFAVGDVNSDGKNIKFVPIADSTRFNSLVDINSYLVTTPIQVTNKSALYYSVEYGISDSLAALNALKGDSFISFKVDILDAVTNESLGTSDFIRFDSSHASQYDNIAYQLNTETIGNRTIKLAMTIASNADIEYSLKNCYATEEVLHKKQNKQSMVKLLGAVNNYDLSQNYPNPFNPATTIRYQIPKDGIVTLKVYDILGREVANLVNEYKKQGRYSVNFDASKLASGVYIYQIKSNDFESSKKMMLLK